MTTASALEYRSRYELVEAARSLGVERPERLTMQELKDEILRLSLSEEEQLGARGLFGVARAMLAGVVEAGLKLPDAAKAIRGDVKLDLPVRSRSPVATVTLAEIYAAQGHRARALSVLDEVLGIEPDHEEALRIRAELLAGDDLAAENTRENAPPLTARLADRASEGGPQQEPAAAGAGQERGEFPSTEYVPVVVVDTTGHEVGHTPPPPLAFEQSPPLVAEPPAREPRVVEPDAEGDSVPLLAIEQRGTSLHLYWELPADSATRFGLTEPESGPAVVVVAFTPSGPRPVRDQRTIRLSWQAPFGGSLVVSDLADRAAVRAAVGWLSDETFLPLSVGRSLERLEAEVPEAAGRARAAFSED